MVASVKYEYAVNARFTGALLVAFSVVKKHLNEHIIYYNFSFLIEKSFQACQVITQSYLLIAFEFIFILKHIFCLPKMPQ